MKERVLYGAVAIGAGILYFLAPQIFHVCEPVPGKIMRCFWTARAEMGVGALFIFSGFLLIRFKSLEARLALHLMGVALAALGGAFPLFLIGVCGNETMSCRAGTLPALVLVSAVAMLISLIQALIIRRRLAGLETGAADD